MANILIVENEIAINELLKRSLHLVGHNSCQAFTGLEALHIAEKETFDLILLDVNLPDLNGFDLIKFIKETPIIYVTARDDISDRVKGLHVGAEDYIIKPFDIEELLARVQVVLRRAHKDQKIYTIGDIQVDIEKYTVTSHGTLVELTIQEFELLKILLINKNIALSRDRLLDFAWGMDYTGDKRTVDVHIQRLRKKLKLEKEIKTIFKLGYRLEI